MAYTDIFHRARISARVDVIVVFERPCDEDEYSAREVGKRAVDCKTDTDAERCDERRDCAGIDADIADKCDDHQHFQADFCDVTERSVNGFVNLLVALDLLVCALCNLLAEPIDNRERNYHYHDRDNDFDARRGEPVLHGLPHLLQIHNTPLM